MPEFIVRVVKTTTYRVTAPNDDMAKAFAIARSEGGCSKEIAEAAKFSSKESKIGYCDIADKD